MSQENAEIVREPLGVRERSSRTLDGRLAMRFPGWPIRTRDWSADCRPPSRLRQAVLWRAARLGLEAWNRRDWTRFKSAPPDWEFHPARELVEAGLLEPCYRGPAGYRDFVSSWFQVWGADARIDSVELIDLGDRLVVARGRAHARSGQRRPGHPEVRVGRHAEGRPGGPPGVPRPRRGPRSRGAAE